MVVTRSVLTTLSIITPLVITLGSTCITPRAPQVRTSIVEEFPLVLLPSMPPSCLQEANKAKKSWGRGDIISSRKPLRGSSSSSV